MTRELINEIIDLVNEQRDSQGMITRVDLTLKIKTLLEMNFKNNSVLDDVSYCNCINKKPDIMSGEICVNCEREINYNCN